MKRQVKEESWTSILVGLFLGLTVIGVIVFLVAAPVGGLLWLVLSPALGYDISFNTVFWIVFALGFVMMIYNAVTNE